MARSRQHEDDPELDLERIDEAVLALLHMGRHGGAHGETRAWKGFDWDVMGRLHEKGMIADPVGKAKSVVFTDEGLAEAERLFTRLFAAEPAGAAKEPAGEPEAGPLGPYSLGSTFVHLDEGTGALPVAVTDAFWSDLMSGRRGDLERGRLITLSSVAEDWNSWEMHPAGDELVCLLSGAVDVILEQEGRRRSVALRGPGSFLLVPRGTWHTAEVLEASTLLFVTPGRGTRHRPLDEAPV